MGIQILKKNGHFSAPDPEHPELAGRTDIARLEAAAERAARALDIGEIETEHGKADVKSVKNDWTKNKNGESYRRNLLDLGQRGIQSRLADEHVPAVKKAIRSAYEKHAPDVLREFEEEKKKGK